MAFICYKVYSVFEILSTLSFKKPLFQALKKITLKIYQSNLEKKTDFEVDR